MEAVKQGSATVGLKSKTHAILVAFKRRPNELASHQKKVLTIDDHVGVSFAGLTADAKSLGRWMRTECLNSRYFHNSPLSLNTVSADLGDKMQLCIQGYNKRPYGVGMLIAGTLESSPLYSLFYQMIGILLTELDLRKPQGMQSLNWILHSNLFIQLHFDY